MTFTVNGGKIRSLKKSGYAPIMYAFADLTDCLDPGQNVEVFFVECLNDNNKIMKVIAQNQRDFDRLVLGWNEGVFGAGVKYREA